MVLSFALVGTGGVLLGEPTTTQPRAATGGVLDGIGALLLVMVLVLGIVDLSRYLLRLSRGNGSAKQKPEPQTQPGSLQPTDPGPQQQRTQQQQRPQQRSENQLRENGPPREQILPAQPPGGPRADRPNLGHGTYTEARQVEAPDYAPKRRAHKALAMAALFFPRTRDGRIIFGCVTVSMVAPIGLLFVPVVPLLLGMVIWAKIKRRRGLLRLTAQAVAWIIVMSLSTTIITLATSLLALLASNGSAKLTNPITSADTLLSSSIGILMGATIWLLMGVPHQAYKIGLDREGQGSAQSLLVGLLTAAACIFTGIYIGLLHYTLLREIPTDQLAVGIIFTVVLVAPYYKSLAQACWRRGVPGFLKINEDVERPWSNTVNELLAARHKPDDVQTTHTNEEGPAVPVGLFVSDNWRWFVGIAIGIAIAAALVVALVSLSARAPSLPPSPPPSPLLSP